TRARQAGATRLGQRLQPHPYPIVEALLVVGAQPREERDVMGAVEDVDRVELHQLDALEYPPEVPDVDPAAGRRSPETLSGECNPPRPVGGQPPHTAQRIASGR